MTDREMLQLAAKAAGIDVVRSRLDDPLSRDFLVNASARNPHQVSGAWNPLTDDGDAFRLADQLQLNVDFCCYRVVRGTKIDVLEDVETGRTAIRRAIEQAHGIKAVK